MSGSRKHEGREQRRISTAESGGPGAAPSAPRASAPARWPRRPPPRRAQRTITSHREAGELKRQPGPQDAERVVGEMKNRSTQIRPAARGSYPMRAPPSGAENAG